VDLILQHTDGLNPAFRNLVKQLDAWLAVIDGDEHSFYAQYNTLDQIKHVVLAYDGETPVGCGAFKKWDDHTAEIKRMFVLDDYRGKGIATSVLASLEAWAKAEGFEQVILETGRRQEDAVALYLKNQYIVTPCYGQYVGIANSICFAKAL